MKRTREEIRERMSTSGMHGRIQSAVYRLCRDKKIQVFLDKEFVLLRTYPDIYIPSRGLAVYIDGKGIHHGHQSERDKQLREMLEKSGQLKILSLEYDNDTKKEFNRLMDAIKEWLE